MANVLLSAKDIEIRFGGVIAADGIDLDVLEGENLAIIGPNGAGKTTFLNISTGYLRPQAGTVTFLGQDITAQLPRTITKLGIARAFQIPQLFLDQTVMENMLIAAASRQGAPVGPVGRSRSMPEAPEMERLLDLVGVKSYAKRTARELPEGQRKLVDIALALALKPRLLLMDEPTSGVASSEKLESWTFSPRRWQRRRSPRSSSSTTWTWWSATPTASRCGMWERSRRSARRRRFWPTRKCASR